MDIVQVRFANQHDSIVTNMHQVVNVMLASHASFIVISVLDAVVVMFYRQDAEFISCSGSADLQQLSPELGTALASIAGALRIANVNTPAVLAVVTLIFDAVIARRILMIFPPPAI